MKFSDLLGEPEPEREVPEPEANDAAAPPSEPGPEPITVFAPVPTAPRLDPSNPIPPVPPIPAATPRQDPPLPAVPPLPPLPPLRPHDVTPEPPSPTPRVTVPTSAPPPAPAPTPVPAPAAPAAAAPPPGSATPSGLMPGGRSGLAELNVRQPPGVPTPTADSSVSDQLTGLTEIVDDLLPSSKRGRK